MRRAIVLFTMALAPLCPSLRPDNAKFTGPARDYELHCRGCHRSDGKDVGSVVPGLVISGAFTHTPEGRAFLVRVPGVSSAPLDDERIAKLLNWMLEKYSPGLLPKDFRPYTAAEVRKYRKNRLYDVEKERRQIVEKLRKAGLMP